MALDRLGTGANEGPEKGKELYYTAPTREKASVAFAPAGRYWVAVRAATDGARDKCGRIAYYVDGVSRWSRHELRDHQPLRRKKRSQR